MTSTQVRRYLFVGYDTLQYIQFKKLEKVSDKIFVFIGSDVESIPFDIVRDVQKMGNNLKWVEVNGLEQQGVNYHICFLMGKLHERISGDVEFAILSNDTSFDILVNYINSTGRSCLRVKQHHDKIENEDLEEEGKTIIPPQYNPTFQIERDETPLTFPSEGSEKEDANAPKEPKAMSISITPDLIEETAKETVRRLIRSGNRPSELLLLKNYILLHNQALSKNGTVDKIIHKLEENQEIELQDEEVIYHF
jgi:PIN domain